VQGAVDAPLWPDGIVLVCGDAHTAAVWVNYDDHWAPEDTLALLDKVTAAVWKEPATTWPAICSRIRLLPHHPLLAGNGSAT